MFDFDSLVTDRTASDVTEGAAKGHYNTKDVNRVEGAVCELNKTLLEAGYPIDVECKTNWSRHDFPTEKEMVRYLDNIEVLQERFYCGAAAELPSSMKWMGYQKANDIEKILAEIEDVRRRMVENYVYCGTFDCGGGSI